MANLVDDDFFHRIGTSQAQRVLIPVWERILDQIQTYDLTTLGEDVIKKRYREFEDPIDRHELSEFYTPDWLFERMVQTAMPDTGIVSVLDPTRGSGGPLRAAIHKTLKADTGMLDPEILTDVLAHIVGIDIHCRRSRKTVHHGELPAIRGFS